MQQSETSHSSKYFSLCAYILGKDATPISTVANMPLETCQN